MSTNSIIILISFILYLSLMIGIGIHFMKKTKTTEDFFLGGRGLSGKVAALSAQASDMSGWLLMGLPGSVYALGTGQSWIAIGLFIGTILNWLLVSGRLRRYTIIANNSLTLPEFFSNRYKDEKRILLLISSIFISIFFLVYTASALASGGKLFNSVFGIEYHVALSIGAIVILIYTLLGGFLAVSETDFVQGLLMLAGLLLVPIVAAVTMGVDTIKDTVVNTTNVSKNYFNFLYSADKKLGIIDILSQLAWALGYFGMPHILVRFMAVKNEKELKKSRTIAISWCFISLFMAVLIGIVGRAYLSPVVLGENGTSAENVFIQMVIKLFTKDYSVALLGGILLCGILAAIMSTADSQLLVTASSVSKDIYQGFIKKDAKEASVMRISKIVVIIVALLAFLIAWNPNSSIMGLVSNAWSGFGSTFGPLVLLSLFWKRTNIKGAIAGMISGGCSVIIWDYIPFIKGHTLASYTGVYSLLVCFFISLAFIIVVSLITKKPSEEICREFEKAKIKMD